MATPNLPAKRPPPPSIMHYISQGLALWRPGAFCHSPDNLYVHQVRSTIILTDALIHRLLNNRELNP